MGYKFVNNEDGGSYVWENDPIVDSGFTGIDMTGGSTTPPPVNDGSDADMAAGLIPPDELKQLTGGKSYSDWIAGAMTPEAKTAMEAIIKSYGTPLWDTVKKAFTNENGTLNLPGIAGLVGAGLGAAGFGQAKITPTGYQGGIPQLTASQPMLTSPPMGRRPGSGGINYGTGVQYRDKNGNIVSDTSTPVEVLDAAARGNGYNQPGTYGQGTTGGGTNNAGIIELLRRLGVAAPAGGNTSGGIANAGGTGGTSVGGGGSGVTTSVGGAQAPAATNLAALKASYDTLSKSGGKQSDLNAWIRAQMAAGMKDTDFQKITGYGLLDIQKAMDAAKNEGRTSGPDTRTGVVAGPGGDNRPTVDYGLKSQGYSRDYSPKEITNIRGTFLQYQNDPKKLAELMNKYGVTMKDLALAQGSDVAGLTNYFEQHGVPTTDPVFKQGATSEEQKKFIAWQGEQVNPVTGRKIKEDWAAQGIKDPYSDPALLTGASARIATAGNREALGVSSATTRPWSSTVVPTGAPAAAAPKTATDWASTPEGQAAGGLPGVYKSIQAYLATNPSATDLANMMQTYGVDDATLAAAKAYNPAVVVGGSPVTPAAPVPTPTEITDIDRSGPVVQPTSAPPSTAADWANTAAGQAAGGINGVYGSINTYLGTNPNEADLQNMMQTYGVTEDILNAAKAYGNQDQYTGGGGMAHGGIAGLKTGRYLQGATDGMADKLPTTIDGNEPAALSHGEFVVPADIVSHLGNGNSDAGAKKLYSMMDKIRMARTGTKKQGKEINPDKFMPGGLARAYAEGGAVKGYAGTDPTGSLVQAGVTGTEQNLSNWVGPYATQMMGQTQALANTPYQAYTGPLTAGASDLQNQAFNTAANLPGGDMAAGFAQQAGASTYTPQTTNFGAAQAQQYMNPYLQASLDPQLAEARRQSDITNQTNNAAMTKAGAFGGGRQAIMTSENQRNLGTNLANITGAGYNTAYQNAMGQFNADQNRQMQENQFGANYGLQGLQAGISGLNTANQMGINNLNTQAGLGATQRGIESEGMAADKAQFEEARKDPYTKLQFQQSMLNGMPITATNYNMSTPSTLQQAISGAGGLAGLFGNKTNLTLTDVKTALANLGINV